MLDEALEFFLTLDLGLIHRSVVTCANHDTVKDFFAHLLRVQVAYTDAPAASLLKVIILLNGNRFMAEANVLGEIKLFSVQIKVCDLSEKEKLKYNHWKIGH